MNRPWLVGIRTAVVGALGAAILLMTPLHAQADPGKRWKKDGDRTVVQRDAGNRADRGSWSGRQNDRGNMSGRTDAGRRDAGNRADRGSWGSWNNRANPGDRASSGRTSVDQRWRDRSSVDRTPWRNRGGSGPTIVRDRRGSDRTQVRDRWPSSGSRGNITFRDRRYSGSGSWGGRSTWRGLPVRRDVLVIRDHRNGGFFRARRLYCAPRYVGRFVYVRPVRYFIAADALIGGVSIRARIGRPHYLYGCNFCDERFTTYGAYAAHVGHCPFAPSGLQISVSNWDDGYDYNWDGPYQAGDDGYYDDSYHSDGSYDDGYYDNGSYDDGSYDDGNYGN